VIGQKRNMFPTIIKTRDGERQAPAEAELDRMLFELIKDTLGVDATAPAPEPAVSADAELRDQACALGLTVPSSLRERFRADMLNLLDSPRR
jgi:hypothetical protein